MDEVSTDIDSLPEWDHVPSCTQGGSFTMSPECSRCFFDSLKEEKDDGRTSAIRWREIECRYDKKTVVDILLLEHQETRRTGTLRLFRCEPQSGSIERIFPRWLNESKSIVASLESAKDQQRAASEKPPQARTSLPIRKQRGSQRVTASLAFPEQSIQRLCAIEESHV